MTEEQNHYVMETTHNETYEPTKTMDKQNSKKSRNKLTTKGNGAREKLLKWDRLGVFWCNFGWNTILSSRFSLDMERTKLKELREASMYTNRTARKVYFEEPRAMHTEYINEN